MADNSAFLKLLDERGVSANDPLRSATPQSLAGENPQELIAAAIARSQRLQQAQAPQAQAAPQELSVFQRLKEAVTPGKQKNVIGREIDTDADKRLEIERLISQ